MQDFKSGFVALIGLPNAGKSTLINKIVGTKIAIVSKKPQTTRNRIAGIYNDDGFQIVFLDTPGIHKAKNRLDKYMSYVTDSSVSDVDLVIFLLDARKGLKEEDLSIIQKISKKDSSIPYIIALNKIDCMDSESINNVLSELSDYDSVLCISALTGEGVNELIERVKNYIPIGPKYYYDNEITDQSIAMLYSEIIREKALKHLGKEIPHGVGVNIEKLTFSRDKDLLNIDAVIYCEKESHKGIIIGKGGSRLRKIGSEARSDIENIQGSQVFLNLWVKVKDDWRNNASFIKALGYSED